MSHPQLGGRLVRISENKIKFLGFTIPSKLVFYALCLNVFIDKEDGTKRNGREESVLWTGERC